MSKEVATTEQQVINPIENLVEKALDKDVNVDVMERLFKLQREWKKDNAKEQFDLAMAKFQGECPIIDKKSKVFDRNGKLLYSYAKLESIVQQVKPFLAKNGLSYMFKPSESDGKMTTICIAKHIAGHNEESEMTVQKGQGTSIQSSSQAVGGDITFSKRYAFCNVFGIMTGDEDTDAQKVDTPVDTKPPEFIEEIKEIKNIDELKEYHNKNGKKHSGIASYAQAINARKEDFKIPIINTDDE